MIKLLTEIGSAEGTHGSLGRRVANRVVLWPS